MADKAGLSVARDLVAARHEDRVLETYPGPLPETLASAYAIQDEAIALRGSPVGGWKIGRVGRDYLAAHKVERLVGPIFADQIVEAICGKPLEVPVLRGFAAAEAELVLKVGETVPPDISIEAVPAYIAEVRFGIEIASSPLPFINDNGPAVTASDFGNNFGLVIGPLLPEWRGGEPFTLTACLAIDGARVGSGRAVDILDGPFGAVAFLAKLLSQRGAKLEAGAWVSTGAITGVHPVSPGQTVHAALDEAVEIVCSIVASSRTSAAEGVGR